MRILGAIIGAAALLAVCGPASAATTLCAGALAQPVNDDGSRYAVIDDQMSDSQSKQCTVLNNTPAYRQLHKYCDLSSATCWFVGHVARKEGDNYFIDRITAKGWV